MEFIPTRDKPLASIVCGDRGASINHQSIRQSINQPVVNQTTLCKWGRIHVDGIFAKSPMKWYAALHGDSLLSCSSFLSPKLMTRLPIREHSVLTRWQERAKDWKTPHSPDAKINWRHLSFASHIRTWVNRMTLTFLFTLEWPVLMSTKNCIHLIV